MAKIEARYPTLKSLITELAQQCGERVALSHKGTETTYLELEEVSAAVSSGLFSRLNFGDRFGYLARNRSSFFELFFGAAKSRTTLVGLNWRLASKEIRYILEDAAVKLVFIEKEFYHLVESFRHDLDLEIVFLDGEGTGSYHGFLGEGNGPLSKVYPEPLDTVLQLYTSGTTGRPKGVEITNEGLLVLRELEVAGWEGVAWGEKEVLLVPMPLFHVGGAVWALIGLYNKAKCVILDGGDAAALVSAVQKYRITRMFVVPTVIQLMLAVDHCEPEAFHSLKLLVYGASPITSSLLTAAMERFGCKFLQMYGMTEASGTVTYLLPSDHIGPDAKLLSCGRPYPGIDIMIVDRDNRALEPKQIGEVLIRTPAIMKGYWRNKEDSLEVMSDGWYRSGDAGYVDEDGYLFIHDRIKDMIVSGGENVYPVEVENTLAAHPRVSEVAVIGVPSDVWGEEVKALVVAQGGRFDPKELISYARERISAYKVPKTIEFRENLPKTASGKIVKNELRLPYWSGQERNV